MYREQSKKMLSMVRKSKSINVMRDFFAQLSTIRPLYHVAIINALNSDDAGLSMLISNSITRPTWINDVSMKEIRNHILFLMWEQFKTIVASDPYYSEDYENDLYHKYYVPDKDPGTYVQELGLILETAYYIYHIFVLKTLIDEEHMDPLEEDHWDMYPKWLEWNIHNNGLVHTVYENFKLLEPLLQVW